MRRYAAVVAVAGLLVACSDGDDPEPTPIGEDAPEAPDDDAEDDVPEPDQGDDEDVDDGAAVDVATIPDDASEIDEDYIAAVLDEVDQRLGQAFGSIRDYIDDEAGAEETLERLGVVFEGPLAADRLAFFGDGNGADAVEAAPTPPQSRLTELQTAEVDCVSVIVERDVEGMLDPPGDPRSWSLTLVPASEPDGLAWRLRHDFTGEGQDIDFDGCIEEVPS